MTVIFSILLLKAILVDLLKGSQRLIHQSRFTPGGAGPMHEPKRMASPLKHCQPGAGKAALYTHTGRFLTVDGLSRSATLSAFSGPWAC